MKPTFQPDSTPGLKARPEATLVDPEAYDASEQQFAASLEQKPGRAKFVVDEPAAELARSLGGNGEASEATRESVPAPEEQPALGEQVDEPPALASDSWRQELQARITDYRTRKRPRPPRYPSLQLKFDSTEDSGSKGVRTSESDGLLVNKGALAAQEITSMRTPEVAEETPAVPSCTVEETGKLLQFPCVSNPAPLRDELAEPVFDQPRILEVPDVVPPPPALGGILIEPAEDVATERRPGFELPLQAAPMPRRVLASAVDCLLVFAAVGLFAYTFFRITSNIPTPKQIAVVFAALVAIFWPGYQYLLLVYAGTTPGLQLARLRLSRFDGRSVPKTLRRWRVLASILSGLSLTLGYAWCFFDEDQLCWHDRITHTYMAPLNPRSQPGNH